MKILIDVNLPPIWVDVFHSQVFEALHWTSVGDARSGDQEIINWARDHGFVVFTHALDFGTILALTHASGPSVIQVRTQDVLPTAIQSIVFQALESCADQIKLGALVTVDELAQRIRILPIHK